VYVVPSIILAFHYGAFDNNDYGDETVEMAALNGRVYENTPTGTYSWGTLDSAQTTTDGQTNYSWTPKSAMTANVLMVAGGGGGGGGFGGGGGAGGAVYSENVSLSGTKNISVGKGGIGGLGANGNGGYGTNGLNTSFTGLTIAVGGGRGGGHIGTGSQYGGSGGGDGHRTTGNKNGIDSQGHIGGDENRSDPYPAGGGGGAGSKGSDASGNYAGNGGLGVDYSHVYGTTYGDNGWFASGGGGGGGYADRGGISGTAYPGGGSDGHSDVSPANNPAQKHTGGGGGGGLGYNNGKWTNVISGESGGSGIVLIADIAYVP
jgi:hypothetical protein